MNIATSYSKNLTGAYRGLFEQFADDASFLWILRSIAVEQPHYQRQDIFQLEQRIDAQLNGLMTSLGDTWPICVEALQHNEPGESFTAAVLAFRSHDVKKIQIAVEAGLSSDETEKGFISALGWLPHKLVHGWIEKFMASKDLDHKYLALAACSVRREDPGDALTRILQREDCKQHAKLYSRALRLIGELRRQDLMQVAQEASTEEQADISFWASRSAILLGNGAVLAKLKAFVLAPGKHQYKAIDLAFRALGVEQGQQWIKQLAADPGQSRAVIRATAALADPHAVNWLIGKMQEAELSRLAGEAFTSITGIDLEQNQLSLEQPEDAPQPPADDGDDANLSLDEDENLPWPDVDKISHIWSNHGRNFVAGQRYFMGRKISADLLRDKIQNARQRQRHAAALELVLIDATIPLPNTRTKVSL